MKHVNPSKDHNALVGHEELSEGLNASPEFLAKWIETREARRLAATLVDLREMAGLSQTELAKLMKKDQAFVSRMESATQRPKSANVALYAKHCGKRTAYAFFEDNEETEGITVHRMTEIGSDENARDIGTYKEVSIPCG